MAPLLLEHPHSVQAKMVAELEDLEEERDRLESLLSL
jgi:hypothetical protein